MKTILATTYAVNPYKGSEDGMGWNYVMQIAKYHKVIAITRENNQSEIERFMNENPHENYKNIQFLYFDCPYWMRFWKKGSRGAMLYFLMWQKNVVRFIKKQQINFDIAHNLNFHNDWTPSYLWKLNKPFVWGPIGHHPKVPAQYLQQYSKKHLIKDRLTWSIKKMFWKLSSDLKQTAKRADHIMLMNSGVSKNFKKIKAFNIHPSIASQDFGWNEELEKTDHFNVISVGRFVPLKGFDLTIHAFAQFLAQISDEQKTKCKLTLVGKGPQQEQLEKLVEQLNISKNVEFIAWMDRKALMELLKTASVFLFPSHEGAGMVVAEALSFGLPVVCLQNEGPGEFIDPSCGFTIPESNYENTTNELGNAILKLKNDDLLLNKMRKNARAKFNKVFDWNTRSDLLKNIYDSL